MTDGLAAQLRDELGRLLAPLAAAATPAGATSLLAALGRIDDNDPIRKELQRLAGLLSGISSLDDSALGSWDGVTKLLELSQQLLDALRGLEAVVSDPSLGSHLRGLGVEMTELITGLYLRTEHPRIHRAFSLVTLIDPAEVVPPQPLVVDPDGKIQRLPWQPDHLHFERLPDLVDDPFGTLRAAYFPNDLTAAADAHTAARRLFPLLRALARAMGLASSDGPFDPAAAAPPLVPPSDDEGVPDPQPFPLPPPAESPPPPGPIDVSAFQRTFFPRFDLVLPGLPTSNGAAPARFGLAVLVSSSEHPGSVRGLILTPTGDLKWTQTRGNWQLTMSADAQIPAFVIGSHGLAVAPSNSPITHATASLSVARVATAGTPAFRLGSADGTRLELGTMQSRVGLDLGADRQSLELSADVTPAVLVLSAGDGDDFLSSVLPSGDIRAELDFGIVLSSATGLHLKSGAGLSASFPTAISLGVAQLQSVTLSLVTNTGLALQATAAVSVRIGPITAIIDGIGIRLALSFPSDGGNLGPIHFEPGFTGPTGVGITVDAAVVSGGGFLFHDATQGVYAGVLQLTFQGGVTLTAYGLIATQMPDGSRGYSLLIFVTAEGFKPIPLGLGFVLESIGGILAVNRTFDQDALRAGLRTDSLAALLFPSDPVVNAPAIIRALSTAFPARRDSYLLGLVARITWFRPILVQLDLALILELGSRNRLLALGRATALLPTADNDLIRLKLDAVGVVDFESGDVACDALLVDSRLAHQFPITGSAALRGNWATGGGLLGLGSFVLAAGGLNPRFAAPPGFPSLERVAIALCSGSNPRLICEAYLAITTNTVQFGSRTSLYAEALGFSVAGELSFDALITLLPPHFIIDFHASMQLKRGSHNLFKVTLDGTLEGPLPLGLAARASFEILWISFSVHFNFTLTAGDIAQAALAAIALVDEVAKALAEAANWSTRLAPGMPHGVTLRSLPPTAARQMLDPLGQLVVEQQVAPLNTGRDVDTYAGAALSGPRRFQVAATLNGVRATAVQGGFAPARYFSMSDDEKLAAPSFELMDSGLVLGSNLLTFDSSTIVPAALTYESIVLNPIRPVQSPAPPPQPPRYTLPVEVLKRHTSTGAAARVPARRVGRARFRDSRVRPAATLRSPHWRIVQASDGAIRPEQPNLRTWSENRAALGMLNRGGARWQMIPAHELDAAPGAR